jgi:hypothetical protein
MTIKDSELVSGIHLPPEERDLAKVDPLEVVKDRLRDRTNAYRSVFNAATPAGFTVLQDLAWVCHAHRDVFNKDPLEMARAVGRREVWLRIQHHLALTEGQLVALYSDVFVKGGFGR